MGTMETLGLHLDDRADAPEYYVWETPGKPIAIHLRYQVIDRLLPDVMRGFGLVPKRGVEVGGLLLGTVEHGGRLTVRIEEYAPVECQHSRGPSFLLSEADVKSFEGALERHRNDGRLPVVGYYRSHTREGLSLSEEDLDLLRTYFPSPSDVALLIKPFATKVSIAGFFFRENGQFRTDQSYLEFPFRRRELGGGAPPPPQNTGREEPLAEVQEPDFEAEIREAVLRDAAATPAPAAPEKPASSLIRPRWVWLPLSFVFLLLGTLLGFQAAITLRGRSPLPQAANGYSLALTAARSGSSLHIQWDRQAPAVLASRRGMLLIADGEFKKQVDLEAAQLQNGSVVYRNVSERVQLRLEVYPGDRNTVSETLEVSRESK